jgi:hypothetical protein
MDPGSSPGRLQSRGPGDPQVPPHQVETNTDPVDRPAPNGSGKTRAAEATGDHWGSSTVHRVLPRTPGRRDGS